MSNRREFITRRGGRVATRGAHAAGRADALVPSPTRWGLPVMFRGLVARR
jgi:hypothetical protein